MAYRNFIGGPWNGKRASVPVPEEHRLVVARTAERPQGYTYIWNGSAYRHLKSQR